MMKVKVHKQGNIDCKMREVHSIHLSSSQLVGTHQGADCYLFQRQSCSVYSQLVALKACRCTCIRIWDSANHMTDSYGDV